MKKTVYLFAVIGLLAIFSYTESTNLKVQNSNLNESTSAKNEKVTICHKPNGNNPHQITISVNALPAHLAHGDTVGSCSGGGNPVP